VDIESPGFNASRSAFGDAAFGRKGREILSRLDEDIDAAAPRFRPVYFKMTSNGLHAISRGFVPRTTHTIPEGSPQHRCAAPLRSPSRMAGKNVSRGREP
jgi:hypothetical protein